MARPPFLRAAAILGLAILSAPLLTLGIFYALFTNGGESRCEQRQVFAEAPSSDGSWTARFYLNVCGGGFGTTYVDDTVEIARPNEAPHPLPTIGVVFEMHDPSSGQPRPMALKWLGARELEITVPNDVAAGTQQSAFADLAVSYRYVPDDPIERACLKQWRTLPTDELLRRSQSSTENMKVFLTECRAKSSWR
jgi:hypothetical protein